MKKIGYLFVAFTILLVSTSATSFVSFDKKEIKIKNTTTFDIDEIYISPIEDTHWGSDILDPDEVLVPGEVITVEVDCGQWDVRLVAPDESECIVEDIHLCGAAQWNIVANCKGD